MTFKTTKAIRIMTVAGLIAFAPTPALAASVNIGAIISGVVNGLVNWFTGWFSSVLEPLIGSVTKSIQGEITKGATATVGAIEAAADYEVQEMVRQEIATVNESLQQPAFTCQAMGVANATRQADESARLFAIQGTHKDTKAVAFNASTDANIANINKRSIDYCTQEDVARGRCRSVSSLPGADMQASYMFGSPDGKTDTYANGQVEAVDNYISRVVALTPPQQLDSPSWERTPQGRAYVEMQRRYAAINSMAAHSLRSIASTHVAQPGLGTRSGTQQLTGRADMSVMDTMKAFVDAKFSSEAMKHNARQTQPAPLLREIAQIEAYRLWTDYQSLRQMERMEGLLATQLVLANEKVMLPQIAAQKAAAVSSAASKPVK